MKRDSEELGPYHSIMWGTRTQDLEKTEAGPYHAIMWGG
jgi:hypothetical protein